MNKLLKLFIRTARADEIGTVTQPSGTKLDGGTAVLLDNHVRTVYSKEIEFKVMSIMRFV